MARKSAIN